jgi:hypothetical protein
MFGELRRHFAWRAELKALDAEIAREARPALAGPGGKSPGLFVWNLPVPGKPDAVMAFEAGGGDYDLFVVPVAAKAFQRAWLARGPQSEALPDGCRLRAELMTDRKYQHAAAAFARGADSPVPLARVGIATGKHGPAPAFTDGITRTFWLLANGVQAFPVIVAGEQAAATLAKIAGAGEPQRAADLVKQVAEARRRPQEPLEAVAGSQARPAPVSRPMARAARRSGPKGKGIEL